MGIAFAYLVLAVSIRNDGTVLRDGCDAEALTVATLPAGQSVAVGFALAEGASPCYKVTSGGLTGFLHAEELKGLEEFVQGRILAANGSTDSIKVTTSQVDSIQKRVAAAVDTTGPLAGATKLIETNQPAAALAKLEPILKQRTPDLNALTLAGIAAWRGDNPKLALEYWKAALEIQPDAALETLFRKVQRETQSDKSGEKSTGMRVNLRYEPGAVTPELAREMLETLDHEYGRIAEQLGCKAEERITAVVQSRDAYLKSTGAAEWSGGQYDGRIRISVLDEKTVGPLTRRAFAHELTHACLSSLGSWPIWFQEGMAQRLSGDRLQPAVARRLDDLTRAHSIPRLESLGRSWMGLSPENASLAYALALRAADSFFENYGAYGIRNILNDPSRFTQVTAALDEKLGL